MIVQIVLIVLFWGALHFYAGRSIVSAARICRAPGAAAWLLTAVIALLPLAAMFAYRANAIGIDHPLQWGGMIAMGFSSILVVATLVADLAGLLLRFRRSTRSTSNEAAITLRRRFLAGATAISIVLTLAGLATAWRPEIVRQTVAISGLDPRLEGMTIALLSDIHVGPLVDRRFAANVTSTVNALNPDVVAIAGDLVDGTPDVLSDHVAPLGGLQARHGVYYVTGNHEYYWNAAGWIDTARALGWNVLTDSHTVINHRGASAVIAGVYDLRARDFVPEHVGDLSVALRGAPPGVFRMLISHQPQSGLGASTLGVQLHVAGHTHAGQYFPFTLLIHAFQPLVEGLYERGGMSIYVTPGTGFWGPPNRLGARGRIVLLTLAAR